MERGCDKASPNSIRVQSIMPFSAIICASRQASDSPAILRANLRFASQTLLEYQVRQAAEAGAEQVMVLVGAVTQPLSRAIDRLTADGIAVTIVRDMVSLLREAPREQDMLLVADGIVAPQRLYTQLAGQSGTALVTIDDGAATANLERIDADQRWAGLARIAPDVLFGTLDMIGDWDLELTLVRAAVQAGAVRIPVSQDEVLEARLALVDRQAGADLVAAALLARPSGGGEIAGAERYLLSPLASQLSPMLLRGQVPPGQVRIGAVVVAAIGMVAVLLHWPLLGLLLFLAALILSLTVDSLVRLARRGGMDGVIGILPQAFVILGLGLAGNEAGLGIEGLYLAGLLGILAAGQRRKRFPAGRPWAVFTPGSAVLLLLLVALGGYFRFGLRAAIICSILSLAWATLGPRAERA